MNVKIEFDSKNPEDVQLLGTMGIFFQAYAEEKVEKNAVNETDETASNETQEEEKAEPVVEDTPVEETPVEEAPVKPKRTRKTKVEKQQEEEKVAEVEAKEDTPEVETKPVDDASSDLPFPVEEQTEVAEEKKEEEKKTMTPEEFRSVFEEVKRKLGIENGTDESKEASNYLRTICQQNYGQRVPSGLPGDKLYEFVEKEVKNLEYNNETGFSVKVPF